MSEVGDVVDRLAQLTDVQLVAAVREATAGRTALAPLHSAAAALARRDDLPAPNGDLPAVPDQPAVPATPDAPPPVGFSVAGEVDTGYSSAGVPTFGGVRDKLERRFGAAFGAEELDADTPAGRSAAEQWAKREKAGQDRLEEIRQSLRKSLRREDSAD